MSNLKESKQILYGDLRQITGFENMKVIYDGEIFSDKHLHETLWALDRLIIKEIMLRNIDGYPENILVLEEKD